MTDNYNDTNLGAMKMQIKEPILCFNVSLPNGKYSIIQLFQYDTPLQMAYRFAVESSLQIKFVKQISESIKQIISAALRDHRVEERVKVQIKQSYSKYVVESCDLEFKMDYDLSDLVDLENDYQKKLSPKINKFITEQDEIKPIINQQQELNQSFGFQCNQPSNIMNIKNNYQPLKQELQESFSHQNVSLNGSKIYDRSINYKHMTEQKQQHIRSFQEQNELRNCTFSPQVNHSQENLTPHRYQKLYEYGKTKIIEKRAYSDQKDLKELQNCTFSPKIGQKSRQLSKNVPKMNYLINNPTNQVSKLLQQLMTLKCKKQIPQLNLKLKQIFDQLDDDGDEYISADHIGVSSLDVQTLKIIYPFLRWVEDQQVILNYNQFESSILQQIPNIEALLLKQQSLTTNDDNNKSQSKFPSFSVKVKNQYQQSTKLVKKVSKRFK